MLRTFLLKEAFRTLLILMWKDFLINFEYLMPRLHQYLLLNLLPGELTFRFRCWKLLAFDCRFLMFTSSEDKVWLVFLFAIASFWSHDVDGNSTSSGVHLPSVDTVCLQSLVFEVIMLRVFPHHMKYIWFSMRDMVRSLPFQIHLYWFAIDQVIIWL